jgi:carbonic anhydrase/acetyltransferase-like protein (isoleucine patch superfamily)
MSRQRLILTRDNDGIWEVDDRSPAPVLPAPVIVDKYELCPDGGGLYQIRALREFRAAHINVTVGTLGGYVSGKHNLAQNGNCWIDHRSRVTGNARVQHDAYVGGGAQVSDNAEIRNNATVYGNAKVYGNASVYGNANVRHSAQVYGNAVVFDSAYIMDWAKVAGYARVGGNTQVKDSAEVGTSGNGLEFTLTGGCLVAETRINSNSDHLTLNTQWGPLTLAKAANTEGYLFMVGCQRRGDIDALERLLRAELNGEDDDYEDDGDGVPLNNSTIEGTLFPGFRQMATALIDFWAREKEAEEQRAARRTQSGLYVN